MLKQQSSTSRSDSSAENATEDCGCSGEPLASQEEFQPAAAAVADPFEEDVYAVLTPGPDGFPAPMSPEEEAFRVFIQEDLPSAIKADVDDSGVFVEYMDALATEANCKSLYVGSKNLPKQSRLHKHGDFDYRYETRSQKVAGYIDFCHPQISSIWTDVKRCATGAAVAAVVAAILAGNIATAKALFYPLFYSCLVSRIGDRAREVRVTYRRQTETGCWENHC